MPIAAGIKWTSSHQCNGCGDHSIDKDEKYCDTRKKWLEASEKFELNKQNARKV